jgi:hypothetical protein
LKNYSFELNFTDDRDSKLPVPPVARVYVQISTKNDGDSHSYISHDCMTSAELDNEIDRLKSELETIRTQGRTKFAASKQF